MKKRIKGLWSAINISTFERRAAIALLFIISLFIIKYTVRYRLSHNSEQIDSAKLAQFKQAINLAETNDEVQVNYRMFNPNEDSVDSLVAKGVPKKLASNIYNYRTKVRLFESRADLKQLYSMTASQYEQIFPYIFISASKQDITEKITEIHTVEAVEEFMVLDINKANAEDFKRIKGIGSVLSKRIIAYRELLGGFVNKTQLKEVYGITDSLYLQMAQFLELGVLNINKIELNTAEFKTMLKHPYFNIQMVKKIVAIRKIEGEITNLNQLFIVANSDSMVFNRILPYVELKK